VYLLDDHALTSLLLLTSSQTKSDLMLIWIGELEERTINTMATSLEPEETCVVKMRVFSAATRLILAIIRDSASTTSSSSSNIGT